MTDGAAGAAKCRVCGGKIENPSRGDGRCYGCYLDALIPPGYDRREGYRWSPVDRTISATVRPPTGVPLLDDGPPTLADMVAAWTSADVAAMIARERAAGLAHDW